MNHSLSRSGKKYRLRPRSGLQRMQNAIATFRTAPRGDAFDRQCPVGKGRRAATGRMRRRPVPAFGTRNNGSAVWHPAREKSRLPTVTVRQDVPYQGPAISDACRCGFSATRHGADPADTRIPTALRHPLGAALIWARSARTPESSPESRPESDDPYSRQTHRNPHRPMRKPQGESSINFSFRISATTLVR